MDSLDDHIVAIDAQQLDQVMDVYSPDICRFPGNVEWFNRGHDEVRREWDEWFKGPTVHYREIKWIDGPYGEDLGDTIWVTGITQEFYDPVASGVTSRTQHKRLTWIFRRGTDGRWRIVLEHFSRPFVTKDDYSPDDPSTLYAPGLPMLERTT